MPDQTFKLQPSILYTSMLAVMILMSVFILIMLPLPGWMQGVLSFFLLVYGVVVIRRYGMLSAKSAIIALKKITANKWQIETRNGVYEGELLGDSTITKLVSVLRFKVQGRAPIVCIVWKFSLAGDGYRQLLVALKF